MEMRIDDVHEGAPADRYGFSVILMMGLSPVNASLTLSHGHSPRFLQ
jgi:hypothetical protein